MRRALQASTSNNSKQTQSTNNLTQKRDIRFAITSIALNVLFLCLNAPFSLSSLIPNQVSPEESNIVLFVFLLLTYVNNGTFFYVNIWLNNSFRDEFKAIFSKSNTN